MMSSSAKLPMNQMLHPLNIEENQTNAAHTAENCSTSTTDRQAANSERGKSWRTPITDRISQPYGAKISNSAVSQRLCPRKAMPTKPTIMARAN